MFQHFEQNKMYPYHFGRICNEILTGKRCRYDNREISNFNKGLAVDLCINENCSSIYKSVCPLKLKCGHKCLGTKNANKCSPCLDKSCIEYVIECYATPN